MRYEEYNELEQLRQDVRQWKLLCSDARAEREDLREELKQAQTERDQYREALEQIIRDHDMARGVMLDDNGSRLAAKTARRALGGDDHDA